MLEETNDCHPKPDQLYVQNNTISKNRCYYIFHYDIFRPMFCPTSWSWFTIAQAETCRSKQNIVKDINRNCVIPNI